MLELYLTLVTSSLDELIANPVPSIKFSSMKYPTVGIKEQSCQETSDKLASNQLEYKFNLIGNNIAIINTQNSITDEGSAKAMVNDLKVKGYKCDYIYLPENSNLTDEVYQVFIGPYENEEETNQWAKNLEAEFNIITL